MSDFFDLISKRQSCRNYLDKPVEKDKLVKCIQAARLAPSACNSQPWHFIVINNKELAAKIAMCTQDTIMNKFTSQCQSFIVVVEESGNLTSRAGALIKHQDYRAIDLGIATEHLCLAATEQDLGTCILGWFDEKELKKLLNISLLKRIRLVIAIGYPETNDIRKKVRKNIEEISTFME